MILFNIFFSFSDYGSEDETDGCGVDEYTSSEYPDEGLGESDSRSFYTEDQGMYLIHQNSLNNLYKSRNK